ncbi:MAG TPA: DinB family protein [Longimicrobiales bacterium]|nr:DinB family protein [Longimicrobiales bacterium]
MSRVAPAAVLAAVLVHAPLSAQQEPVLVADILRDVAQVEAKVVGLAEAIPEAAYGWRPGEGVRSVAELFKHVISDNWLIGGIPGAAPPAASGIDPADYRTAGTYEARALTKAEIVADLKASFGFLADAVRGTDAGKLAASLEVFGRPMTQQQLWILASTHLHEHLGQGIAYARMNGVVPPWSR